MELITQKIIEQRFLPIYFAKDADVSIALLKTLYQSGVRAVEYTNRGESALHNFIRMKKLADTHLPGMLLGIGTIKDADSAKEFMDAGADFIISPGLVTDVVTLCQKENVLMIPGCMTPTEIMMAEKLKVGLIKLFPGNVLGPGFIKSIRSLFPDLLFMPTGGVSINKDSIREWLDAGACAVGLGSTLVSSELIETRDYQQLTQRVEELNSIIEQLI